MCHHKRVTATYVGMVVKCSNVVECACFLVCVLCQPVHHQASLYIWYISLEIFYNFLFLLFLNYCSSQPVQLYPPLIPHISDFCHCKNCAMPPTHLRLMRQLAVNASSYPSTCTDEWRPTVSTVGLPSEKAQMLSRSHAQNEAQIDDPKRISWLLVAIQNATRIALRRQAPCKKKAILTFDCFRFATLYQLLHGTITTADWGRLYKLLYVLLDASMCSPAMISP